jgi:cytochrome b subunit of formate dehydrogenase
MYQIISTIVFLITLAGVALHCIAFPADKNRRWNPLKKILHFCTFLLIEQKLSFVGVVRKLIYLLALLCFVVLGFTGFYPTLALNEHISGYLLMIHATFAPIFAICLAVLAVMWASRCGFTYSDWPGLRRFVQRVTLIKNAGEEPLTKSNRLLEKATFWLILSLALPLILSMVLSMLPYFGTDWQELLLTIHRWTALVFAVVVFVHTYMMIRIQMKQ